MEFLTELAGNPERCAPSIHIAGSKGKGSVTGMLTAMLSASGFRAARYMSPHVIDIRERICLGDSYFSEEIYCNAGDELRRITEELLPAAGNPLFDTESPKTCEPTASEPTFWELLTLLFFLCARMANCDVMVVETGMGGRLDSTNVLDPLVSVITLIELEHTAILGNTLAKIAGEKAGIIKKGKPLILAKQSEEALEVFKKKAEEKNSPLFYLPEIAELSNIKITPQGTDFSLSIPHSPFFIPNSSFVIPLPGKVQAENAALAIAALKTAFPQIGIDIIRRGLSIFYIPGRFEKIINEASIKHQEGNLRAKLLRPVEVQGPFIIDGAHTPESLALCMETFCLLYGEGGILLFGCAADKDASAMAEITHLHFSKIIITTPGAFKASNPENVYEVFKNIAGHEKTLLVKDTREAVKMTMEFTCDKNYPDKILPALGTGSFYLVSEIRKIIYKDRDVC
ncbi:MAG: Mur ligase family protein [Treponema sp.]|nr:Mur ligase family protein [Treponema sp.]